MYHYQSIRYIIIPTMISKLNSCEYNSTKYIMKNIKLNLYA